MTEKYIKRIKKGKGKKIKHQNKKIKELISKSNTHNLINKIIVNTLINIFKEKENNND